MYRKAEIENRRKLEEKKREQDELTKRDFEILKAEQEKEEARLREQMEQERRDHELALRLANECNSQVEELSTVSKTWVPIQLMLCLYLVVMSVHVF